MKMGAVVLAGGVMTQDDPLYAEAPNGSRSMIDIHGKPMVQWVIDALNGSKSVSSLYIIGLPADCDIETTKPVHFLSDEGGLFENIRAGVIRAAKDDPEQTRALVVSSDIPAIRPEMVDWLAAQVKSDSQSLIFYNVIPRKVMENRYPESNRSYVHFRDITICGGDMNIIDKGLFAEDRPIWKQLAETRKHPLRQAGLLGFENIILVALRLVTLNDSVKRVCKKLSLSARALVCPYAELGMDADKPHQLAILRNDLEGDL